MVIAKNNNSFKLKRKIRDHGSAVRSVVFSPKNKRLLISGSWDKSIRVWNQKSKKTIKILKGHSHGVITLNISKYGDLLASGSADKTIKLWNLDTLAETKTLSGHVSEVRSVGFSPDGKILVSGS